MRTNENLPYKNIELYQLNYEKTALYVENVKGEIFVYYPTSWSLKPKVREIC